MRLYKDIYLLYVTLSLGVTMVVAVLAGKYQWNPLIVIPVVMVWVAANYFFWKSRADNRTKATEEKLHECRIEEYVNACEQMHRNVPDLEFGDTLSKNEIKLKLAFGYYSLGEYDKMEHMLKTIKPVEKINHRSLMQQAKYHTDWALYYLDNNKIDEAEGDLKACQEILENPKIKEPDLTKAKEFYQDTLCYLNMKKEDYEGVDKIYKSRLLEDNSLLNKVILSYRLGRIYWHYDMIEEAKKHFDFASKYGGDSLFAYEAEKMLKKKGRNSQ